MKTKVWLGLFSLFGIFSGVLNAQQISAISSIAYQFISGANVHTPAGDLSVVGGASPSIIPNGYYVIVSHSTTQEEYVAQLYYDVGTTGALYYGSSPNLLQTGSVSGNGIATGAFIQRVGYYGLYSVSTDHYLIAYFVSSVGQYYDPYGFGVTSPVQVDDNGGYWISVTVFATYITAAAILSRNVLHRPCSITESGADGAVPGALSSLHPPGLCAGTTRLAVDCGRQLLPSLLVSIYICDPAC